MADIIYVTNEGLKKLQEELKYLKETKRVEIAKKLKEAIEFGDLSENAEYEEARNLQAQVEVRINDLEEQLKHVEIIKDSAGGKNDKVSMGSIVKLEDKKENEELTFKIVGTTESNILLEVPQISNESPIGEALLGKKVGDTVKAKSPSGTSEFKILEIN